MGKEEENLKNIKLKDIKSIEEKYKKLQEEIESKISEKEEKDRNTKETSKGKKLSNERTDASYRGRIYLWTIFGAIILIALDQITKLLITENYKVGEGKSVIKDVFEFQHIRNKGSAWGMFDKTPAVPITIAVIMIGLIIYVYINLLKYKRYRSLRICVVFLLSGAVGNIIDRIRLGSVTDFLYFKLIDFPVFNVADIYVTLSIVVIIFLLIFRYGMKDIDVILGGSVIDKDGKIIEKAKGE
ncbi:lipoprotein signal peptidase [Eubacterium ruminantium]|uniref:Lipoprotein signal peptidase n=1 Tax=Eubacterium ruminantium TaxID=42322 RepID=A0A1T4M280_9FIRM|nr:signal peptidase II [Eubacterium ruminantium]SCW37664.1 lipoprotein signal peptidase [Eubacterium ruminantium]SDM46596.1 lipoprotein signal peptidase [Eubacterium ruminantium]SJZ60987.1 lipoprotein signal peptidase [Eubacterium ruminantium]